MNFSRSGPTCCPVFAPTARQGKKHGGQWKAPAFSPNTSGDFTLVSLVFHRSSFKLEVSGGAADSWSSQDAVQDIGILSVVNV